MPSQRAPLSGALLLLLVPSVASASGAMSSSIWEVNYGDCGTWNDPGAGAGVLVNDPNVASAAYGWNDISYTGSPWQQLTVEFEIGGTAYLYEANDGQSTCDFAIDEEDINGSNALHVMTVGDLVIMKYEQITGYGTTATIDSGGTYTYWDHYYTGRVWFEVWNQGAADMDDFRLMWALDPAVDQDSYGWTTTYNDVENEDTSDSYDDWATSQGSSGLTFGLSPCEPGVGEIGFSSLDTDADGSWSDPGDAWGDQSVHWSYQVGTLQAGDANSMGFFFGAGSSYTRTEYITVNSANGSITGDDYCGECDYDGDEFTAEWCGGNDCDDEDASINPFIAETWYDNVDSDCDGWSDFDQDGDGYDSDGYGGTDCDDTDDSAHPGGAEIDANGVDEDCDGYDGGVDSDGDGVDDDDEANIYGTDPDSSDTDGDGLDDGDEIHTYGTDPLNEDSDGEGSVSPPPL